jgi:hypothetical protein
MFSTVAISIQEVALEPNFCKEKAWFKNTYAVKLKKELLKNESINS